MRLKSFLLFPIVFLMVLWLPSCKKNDSSKPALTIVNTWTFQGKTDSAGYSDIITKKGFTLIFHPQVSSHSNQELKFIFPTRPEGDQSFSVATDTNNAQTAIVYFLTEKGGYHSLDGDTSKVRTQVVDNKIYLTGFNLSLESDSLPGTKSSLSFNLTQF